MRGWRDIQRQIRQLDESVSGYLGTSIQFPERVHELAERIARGRGLRIARSNTRAELRVLIPYIKEH